MISWRSRRQVFFGVIFLLLLSIPIFLYVFFSKQPPTCFDGKQNQNEQGVDCGGICVLACKEAVSNFVTRWQRLFYLRDGGYELAALIENPNKDFSARSFTYIFEIYDKENSRIFVREGVGISNPRETFLVLEGGISLPKGETIESYTTFFEITDVVWERKDNFVLPRILIRDETLSLFPAPRLSATLINDSPGILSNIDLSAIIFNEEDDVVAVSKTALDTLPQDTPRRVFFTWPEVFTEPPRICLDPVEAVLVFDRSGSMNDDEDNPPEPITTAKAAAKSFVNQLSVRDKVGLVSFATNAQDPIDHGLSGDLESVKRAIDAIVITPEDERGFTNLGDGIIKGNEAFLSEENDNRVRKALVILTDGRANTPESPGGELYAEDAARKAKGEGKEIYTIGLGGSVNQAFLRKIATTPEHYFFSQTKGELADIYGQIAQNVCPERVYLTGIFVRVLHGGSSN